MQFLFQTPQGVALLVSFAALFIALLVVLDIRERTARRKERTWLLNNIDDLVTLLTERFGLYAGDRVITSEELIEAQHSNKFSEDEKKLIELLIRNLPVVGSVINSGILPLGVGGMPPHSVYFETHGLRKADLPLIGNRLAAHL